MKYNREYQIKNSTIKGKVIIYPYNFKKVSKRYIELTSFEENNQDRLWNSYEHFINKAAMNHKLDAKILAKAKSKRIIYRYDDVIQTNKDYEEVINYIERNTNLRYKIEWFFVK